MLINKIFKTHPFLLTIGQDYSNGRPRSKSELLDGESRTTSTSQRSILYTEVFTSKSDVFSCSSSSIPQLSIKLLLI